MGRSWKSSRYNYIVSLADGRHLAFNAMTCGLAELRPDSWEAFSRLIDTYDDEFASSWNELASKMKEGGFLIPDDVEELDVLRAGHYAMRFGRRGLGLTIIPTLRCNFSCDYCYEHPESRSSTDSINGIMSDEVAQRISRFAEGQLEKSSALSVTWYGGEPLMAKPAIQKLTVSLKSVCERRESLYRAGMVTNGYLLSQSSLQFVLDADIGFLQITLDGPRDVHNSRRCLRSGGETYDTILSNIARVKADTPISISIRVNIDKRNAARLPELLDDLVSLGLHTQPNISIYIAQTVRYSNSCPDIGSQCMITREFAEFMVEAYREATSRGFSVSVYPAVPIGTCGAVATNSVVVEPDGSIQNCWNTVGNVSHRTGVLSTDGIDYNPNRHKWLGWSAFRGECLRCPALPICMGGCPYRTLYAGEVTDAAQNKCYWWKYNLAQMLVLTAEAKRKGLLRFQGRVL